MLQPPAEALGYAIVLVRRMNGHGGSAILQILAERQDHRPMSIDDCATLSRELSTILDVEDPISDTYTLEVSSPGIDRPLVRLEDYDRFTGFDVKLETGGLYEGRRRFQGRLVGRDDNTILVDTPLKTDLDGKKSRGKKHSERMAGGKERPSDSLPDGAVHRRVGLPFGDIVKAKLVLTDALIAATAKQH